MIDDATLARRSWVRRVLCLAPPLRDWFADIDGLASDARAWRGRRNYSSADQAVVLEVMACLAPRRAIGVEKTRLGRAGDGGYVMLDDFDGVCGALSFGISDDCSWDTELANRGIDVHQYDHSVAGPPVPHPRFRFFQSAVGRHADAGKATLGTTIAELPPPQMGRLVLKIDIEGAEWDVFDAATSAELARFSQIVGEFHGFADALKPAWRERALRVLRKIRADFELVHVHANNTGRFDIIANVPVPDLVELTFVNRAIYPCEDACEVYPTPIDQSNSNLQADIFLGTLKVT